MPDNFFDSIFRNMIIPVVVCQCGPELDVVYENTSAKMLLNPLLAVNNDNTISGRLPLSTILRFEGEGFDRFCTALRESMSLPDYVASIQNFEGEYTPVSISGSAVEHLGDRFRVLYIHVSQPNAGLSPDSGALLSAFHLSHSAESTDEAIQSVLAFAGVHAGVSRTYIFEETAPNMTSNTYEWCAASVESMMSLLQNLPKSKYSYDELISRGLLVTDDIRKLSGKDREVLEQQGVKSVAIIPMFNKGTSLGYVGFDDCDNYRHWTMKDIRFLKGLAGILASLIVRRNMERGQSLALQTLQTITDSNESIVYVSDLITHELIFINRAMAHYIGAPAEQLLGKPCWQVLHRGRNGPCDYCRIGELNECSGPAVCEWEHRSGTTGKWYRVRDSIIKWTDGRDMHLGTLIEITSQKEHEARLEHIASRDMMTGIYNRAWGCQFIEHSLLSSGADSSSLVFIDLDGLKYVNDTYGHDEGDKMIIGAVNIIQSNVRKSDVLIRWGGDEFILVLQCPTAQAEIIMNNVVREMEAFNATGIEIFKLSFSYGIVPLEPGAGRTVDDLVSCADKLMYKNKMSKRKTRGD